MQDPKESTESQVGQLREIVGHMSTIIEQVSHILESHSDRLDGLKRSVEAIQRSTEASRASMENRLDQLLAGILEERVLSHEHLRAIRQTLQKLERSLGE